MGFMSDEEREAFMDRGEDFRILSGVLAADMNAIVVDNLPPSLVGILFGETSRSAWRVQNIDELNEIKQRALVYSDGVECNTQKRIE